MSTILAFGASTSSKSINQKLASYTVEQLNDVDANIVDLNDFEMPIFSVDREQQNGIPPQALHFKEMIKAANGIIISFAEHNGSFSAAFKNILDWTSRIEKSMWNQKPMFLMAASPGGRGGSSVLETAVTRFPYMDARVVAQFSLPSFHQNFGAQGILDEQLKQEWHKQLELFETTLY